MTRILTCLLALFLGSLAVTAFSDDTEDMALPEYLPPPVLDSLPSGNLRLGETSMLSGMEAPVAPHPVSVLFLYAEDAVRLYGSPAAVQGRIGQILQFANTAFTNSGINIELLNAGMHLVYYDNDNITSTAFSHLTNKTHPAFAPVNTWRMQSAADIVVLLRPRKGDVATCGKAYLNGGGLANPETTFWTMGGYAYAHVSINCYDFVLAHEIGHILGLVHTRSDTSSRPYPYGAGYRINNDFTTIMASTKAYDPPPTALPLSLFSSPSLTCTGYSNIPKPCGIDAVLSNGADAVLAVNQIAAQAALFSDDSDADGMPDWFEHFWGLNRFDPQDAQADADGDGLSNLGEFLTESYAKAASAYGITLAMARDTDSDGVLDGVDALPTIAGNPVFDLQGQYRGSRISDSTAP